MYRLCLCCLCLVAALISCDANAHAEVITPYDLPVPLSLYFFACGATLVITFAVAGYFLRNPDNPNADNLFAISLSIFGEGGRLSALAEWALRFLRVVTVALLALTVTGGLIGVSHPQSNLSITLFWIIFLLGSTYSIAIVGNFFQIINPWVTIVAAIEALGCDLSKARYTYPARFAYYPALVLYIALIWTELFVLQRPSTLSFILLSYSLLNLAGSWLFGKNVWFEYAEFFSVFFRLIGYLAPVDYVRNTESLRWEVYVRRPFAGLLQARAIHMSLVLIVLFILSSTTYDAIHNTEYWRDLFWRNALTLTQPLWGTDLGKAQSLLMPWYLMFQRMGLVLSPVFYLGLYLLAIWIMRHITRSTTPLTVLARQFALSIMPIAFVYNITHNLTHILETLVTLPVLLSDPFGFGWNIFHIYTAPQMQDPIRMGMVWHTQVLLILGGHAVSVVLSHMTALRHFTSRRRSALSQLPLLTLMVGYTAIGLWILTLPIKVAAD
jgi:hypothetical protein